MCAFFALNSNFHSSTTLPILSQETGPQETGPQGTGPQETCPQETGPQETGPQETGPEKTKPDFSGDTQQEIPERLY